LITNPGANFREFIVSSLYTYSGDVEAGSLVWNPYNYLVVLTIARRREPFANCSDTLVSLELIGENFTILPVIPVLLVVNKSPSWYVYPPSVICIAFRLWCRVGEQF
jgi:hypothetical protein